MSRKTYSIECVNSIKSKLAALPPKPVTQMTLRDFVNHIKDDIYAMLKIGYTLADVVKYICDEGVHITIAQLRFYLRPKKNAQQTVKRGNAGSKTAGNSENKHRKKPHNSRGNSKAYGGESKVNAPSPNLRSNVTDRMQIQLPFDGIADLGTAG